MWTKQYRRQRSCRRGYTLALLAMLLFALLGLAALVIDVGLARLAQRQMQVATHSGALEGLRFRDDLNVPEPQREQARRQRASDFVAWMFDDDLDPALGDDGAFDAGHGQFGAGPSFELTDGVGDPTMHAGKRITISSPPVFKPTRSDGAAGLELNLDDQIHGDMLAGGYDAHADHREEADYARQDFRTNTPNTPDNSAFLVRMRRTNDRLGLDSEAGVSSRGPTLPYLFGQGAMFPALDPAAGYSPRHHGVTIRATSIAQERPAMSIGMADDSLSLTGLVPLAFTVDYWNTLEEDSPDSQAISPDGTIQPDGTIMGDDGVVGRFFAIGSASEMPLTIGRAVPLAAPPPDGSQRYDGYVPVYAVMLSSDVPRVVGFGEVTVDVLADSAIDVRRKPSPRIGTENVSAVRCFSVVGLSTDEAAEVFRQSARVEHPLLAPALVR